MRRAARSTSSHGDADHPGRHPRPLGLVEYGVRLDDLRRRWAEVDAAGDVTAVPVHGSAEVAQHDVAPHDHPGPPGDDGGWPRSRPRRRWRSSPCRGPRRGAGRTGRPTPAPRSGRQRDVAGVAAAPPTRSAAAPAAASAAISAASLRDPERPDDLDRPRNIVPGRSGRRSTTKRAQVWSPTRRRDRPPGQLRPRWPTGSSVSFHGRSVNTPGCSTTRGASSRGTTSVASLSRGSTSIVSRSSGMAR